METKIGSKNRIFREIWGNYSVRLRRGKRLKFRVIGWFEKIERSELNCSYFETSQSMTSKSYKTVNSFFYVKFKKILIQLFVNPLKRALLRPTTKTSRSFFVLIVSFFCSWK